MKKTLILTLSSTLVLAGCASSTVSSSQSNSSSLESSSTSSSIESSSSSSSSSTSSSSSSSSSDSSSSSSSSSISSSSSSSSSDSSSSSSSSSSDYSIDVEKLKEEYGDFSIEQTKNGGAPVFDESTNTYTLSLTAKKSTYTLKGFFDGAIVISNTSGLESFKGCNLIFDQACLAYSGDSSIIHYTEEGAALTLAPTENSNNLIFALGSGIAVESDNTTELAGAGNLSIVSYESYAVKSNKVRAFESPAITISAGIDGLHGHSFVSADDETEPSSYFSGSIDFEGIGRRAFDFSDGSGTEDDPYCGYVDIGENATIKVESAASVARVDTLLSIEGSVIANSITEDAVVTKNTGNCQIVTTGTFTVNGLAYPDATI